MTGTRPWSPCAHCPRTPSSPATGPFTGKDYLDEQKGFIQEWVEYVQSGAGRGMSKDEAVAGLTAMTDRYPMDVG